MFDNFWRKITKKNQYKIWHLGNIYKMRYYVHTIA